MDNPSLEEARASLEAYLVKNVATLINKTYDYVSLRRAWFEQNQQFADLDLYLDLEWTECWADTHHGGFDHSTCCGGFVVYHARGFRVRIVNRDEYDAAAEIVRRSLLAPHRR